MERDWSIKNALQKYISEANLFPKSIPTYLKELKELQELQLLIGRNV